MKLTFIRTSVLLALALGGCGGKATFELGGPVINLSYEGLELTNMQNGDKVVVHVPTPAGADTRFTLPKTINYGDLYDVRITAQPDNEDCGIAYGSDTAGRLAAINIVVSCTVRSFLIGGTVSGLREVADATPTGLVITNGTDQRTIEVNGTYAMPAPVAYGSTYAVVIVQQPKDKICTVAPAYASGTLQTTLTSTGITTNPVDKINIDCVDIPPSNI